MVLTNIKKCFLNLEKIVLEDAYLKRLDNDIDIKNIKTIKTINYVKNKNYIKIFDEMEKLYNIFNNKNIKNIEINCINKEYMKVLNNISF